MPPALKGDDAFDISPDEKDRIERQLRAEAAALRREGKARERQKKLARAERFPVENLKEHSIIEVAMRKLEIAIRPSRTRRYQSLLKTDWTLVTLNESVDLLLLVLADSGLKLSFRWDSEKVEALSCSFL